MAGKRRQRRKKTARIREKEVQSVKICGMITVYYHYYAKF